MDNDSAIGIVTLIERTFYFVCWQSGDIMGYTTAHSRYDIRRWKKNLKKKLDNST